MWDRVFEIISMPKACALGVIFIINIFYSMSIDVFLRTVAEEGIVEGAPVLMFLVRSPERIMDVALGGIAVLEICVSVMLAFVIVAVNSFLFRVLAFLSSYALNERYAYWRDSFSGLQDAEINDFLLEKGKQIECCERTILIVYNVSCVVFSVFLVCCHQSIFFGTAYACPIFSFFIYIMVHCMIVVEIVSKYIPALALHDVNKKVTHDVAKRILNVTR